jgi:hypothetical protein
MTASDNHPRRRQRTMPPGTPKGRSGQGPNYRPDRSDARQTFVFLIALSSLPVSLAIVVWYNLESGVALLWPSLGAHRLAVFLAALTLIWAPASFVYLRAVLARRLASGALPAEFNTWAGSIALCATSALSATVAILTYGTPLAGGTGRAKTGTWFIWVVSHYLLIRLALGLLKALPPKPPE